MKKQLLSLYAFFSDTGKQCIKLRKKYSRRKSIITMIRYRLLMRKCCCSLPMSADISDDICFPHGLNGIFISSGAHIGRGCTVFHHVTIGSNTLKDSKHYGAPYVADNVFIGAGAKVIGGIKIGNGARIGAGCVVTEDIPDGATVVMQKPAIIMHNETRDNSYQSYSKEG